MTHRLRGGFGGGEMAPDTVAVDRRAQDSTDDRRNQRYEEVGNLSATGHGDGAPAVQKRKQFWTKIASRVHGKSG